MRVLLTGIDITEYIQGNTLQLTRAKNEPGQVLINPVPTLNGIDVGGFWNPLNPASVFYGINDLSIFDVQILDEETVIFDGSIQTIDLSSSEVAKVSLQSELQSLLDKNLLYSTGGVAMSPADIFVEVCNLYEIPYDAFSVNQSKAVYGLNSVVCTSNVLKPNTPIIDFLQQIALVGVASIFSIGNVLYFQVFDPSELTPVLSFKDCYDQGDFYLLSSPSFSSLQKQVPQGYSVVYYDKTTSKEDQTETYGIQSNAFSISGGQNDLVTIASLQSAVWIGDKTLDYLQTSEIQCQFDIPTRLAQELQVSYPFRLELSDGTEDRTYRIRELTTLNSVQTRLVGVGNASN